LDIELDELQSTAFTSKKYSLMPGFNRTVHGVEYTCIYAFSDGQDNEICTDDDGHVTYFRYSASDTITEMTASFIDNSTAEDFDLIRT